VLNVYTNIISAIPMSRRRLLIAIKADFSNVIKLHSNKGTTLP
jgi:hypothetical protein